MASLLDMLIFDAVYGSWILSLPLFTLGASISTSKLVVDIVPEVAAPSPVIFH